jgi:hypothetical protein
MGPAATPTVATEYCDLTGADREFDGPVEQSPWSEWMHNPPMLHQKTGLVADEVSTLFDLLKDPLARMRGKRYLDSSSSLLPSPANMLLIYYYYCISFEFTPRSGWWHWTSVSRNRPYQR